MSVCVSVGVSVGVLDSSGVEARGQQLESVPFFLCVGAQVVRLGHKHIYLMSILMNNILLPLEMFLVHPSTASHYPINLEHPHHPKRNHIY